MLNSIFDQMDFGPLQEFLEEDDITDISYSNGGQVWLKTLSKGIFQVNRPDINNQFMEKLAFQCSNVMGKTFNMAHPFLDAESAELRMNFVHDSIATNGIAVLIRKTPAKIRLNKEKLLTEQYVTEQIHDFLIKCVEGHANIMVAGETGSGKTELVKYLASKTKADEKIISIEDTLELHLDRIFPTRDIVAMKTNNIASYTEALVACMRQNPIWILLAEVRSAEAVLAVRNSISSGHHIMSTIHADRAASIPMRMYSLLESSQDTEQFLGSIHRYIQIGIYVKGYFSKRLNRFQREIIEVCEFYVDKDTQKSMTNILYQKSLDGKVILRNPTQNLLDYLSIGNVNLPEDTFGLGGADYKEDNTNVTAQSIEEAKKEEIKVEKPKSTEDPFTLNAEESKAESEMKEHADTKVEEQRKTIENATVAPGVQSQTVASPIASTRAQAPVQAQNQNAFVQPVQAAQPVQQSTMPTPPSKPQITNVGMAQQIVRPAAPVTAQPAQAMAPGTVLQAQSIRPQVADVQAA